MIEPGCIEVRLFPFQIHKMLNHDILDLLNKPKIVRSCIFLLANLYFELSVDFVPQLNPLNCLILWYICSDNTQSFRRIAYFSNTK